MDLIGLAPMVSAISRRARGAPVKGRIMTDGMAAAVIKTAFLSLFFDLMLGRFCPQGQNAKQASLSINRRVTAVTLKKFTGAPMTSPSQVLHSSRMDLKSSARTHWPGSVPGSCVHWRQFRQNSMCASVR